jgi:hypothetical protein
VQDSGSLISHRIDKFSVLQKLIAHICQGMRESVQCWVDLPSNALPSPGIVAVPIFNRCCLLAAALIRGQPRFFRIE